MNSFTLMAEVLTNPELRTTPDTQTPVANFLVQFTAPGAKPEDLPSRLRVAGWGNLATQIQEKYRKGDQVLIEGRLRMNTIDRGAYKEKVAELVAQRIIPLSPGAKADLSDFKVATPAYDYDTVPAPMPIEDPTPDDVPF